MMTIIPPCCEFDFEVYDISFQDLRFALSRYLEKQRKIIKDFKSTNGTSLKIIYCEWID